MRVPNSARLSGTPTSTRGVDSHAPWLAGNKVSPKTIDPPAILLRTQGRTADIG
jgi:hypothetical protein